MMTNEVKEILIASVLALVLGLCAVASPASLPAKAVIKGGEKVAAKAGLRVAGEGAVRGGAKLAAVTAEREAAKSLALGAAAKTGERLTAGKILAGGAAVALVAGTCKSADGVQTALSGIGEAARENPDVAEHVADSLTAPFRHLLLAGGAMLLVGVAWFIWPWFSLARNASRYAAAKREMAMRRAAQASANAPCDGAGAVNASAVQEPSAARSGFALMRQLMIVAALALICTFVIRGFVGGGTSSSALDAGGASSLKSKAAKRAEAVARMRSEYKASIDRHYANFLSEVKDVASQQFGVVRDGIPGVVSQYGMVSRCKQFVWDLARDKAFGGDRAGEGVRKDLEADYFAGLYQARDKVNACLVEFLRNADAARRAFRIELETELDSVELPGDEAYRALLEKCGEGIEAKKDELSIAQVVAGIDLAFEAVFIRSTVAAASVLLGGLATRMATSATFAVGAALADSPVCPIGDMIGAGVLLGATLWSIRDINRAAKVLPEELGKTLTSATNDCEQHTLDEVKSSGEKIYRAYCDIRG